MTWQEAVATIVVRLGLFAGAFLFARRPAFWIEFGARLFGRLWPSVWAYISKRMPPEEEAEWRAAQRAGRGDEWIRKRMTRNRRQG